MDSEMISFCFDVIDSSSIGWLLSLFRENLTSFWLNISENSLILFTIPEKSFVI